MKASLKLTFEAAMTRAQRSRDKSVCLSILQQWADEELRDKRCKLNDEKRRAIRTSKHSGETVREIADKVELSVPTVRRVLNDG